MTTDHDRIAAAIADAVAAEPAAEGKPTGACHISVGEIQNCTAGLTFDSCARIAARVGGVMDWRQGQAC